MDHGDEAWRVFACAGGVQDKTILNRIMLRFRPIAPKPVHGNSISGEARPDEKKGSVTRKRKYVRVKKNIDYRKRTKKEKTSSPLDLKGMDRTAQSGLCKSDLFSGSSSKGSISFNNSIDPRKVQVQDDRIGVVSVTVESVTDTNVEASGLGSTDAEKKKNLEGDTCPGFISEGLKVVQWTNEALRKLVSGGESESKEVAEVGVRLEVKEKLVPYVNCCEGGAAFTCWVRLQYAWQKDKCCSEMVPCDVWRMDCGGFAWRLDVQAALGLVTHNNVGKLRW